VASCSQVDERCSQDAGRVRDRLGFQRGRRFIDGSKLFSVQARTDPIAIIVDTGNRPPEAPAEYRRGAAPGFVNGQADRSQCPNDVLGAGVAHLDHLHSAATMARPMATTTEPVWK